MKSSKFIPFPQFVVTVLLLLIIVSSYSPPSLATARDVQNKDQFTINYDVSLFPFQATINTIKVTLTLSNLMGETPPSAKWYDPDGKRIDSGGISGSPVREYIRYYGSLVETRDYFYISNRASSLKPGRYRVVVSGYADETFFLIVPEKVYLPLIKSRPFEMPATPVLDDINNNGFGIFTVAWSRSSDATTYILQEDDNAGFSSPTVAYTGAETSVDLNRGLGTYYYRVNASNPEYTSPWSNVESAVVTIEPPHVGHWSGTVSGGNTINMDVIDSGTMIDTIAINVNWGGACGVSATVYYYYDVSINSAGHFSKSHASGSSISGDFTSSTAADGTFYAVLDTGTCTATRSGTWTANYVP